MGAVAVGVVPGEARVVARLVRGYLLVMVAVVAVAGLLALLDPDPEGLSRPATLVGVGVLLSLQLAGVLTDWEQRLLHGDGQRLLDALVVALVLVHGGQPVLAGPDPTTVWGVAVTAVFAGLVTSTRGMVLVSGTLVLTTAVAAVRHAGGVDPLASVTGMLLTAVLAWLAWYAGSGFRQLLRDRDAVALELATRTEQVRRAQQHTIDELRRLDRLKDDFISTVSHELRTPLTVVRGLALTLDRDDVELDASTTREIVSRLASNAVQLEQLVARLLDFDQLLEPTDRHLVRADVDRCVAEAVAGVDPRAHDVSFEPGGVEAGVSGPLLVRVLEELVDNAVRHTPGGTTVRVTSRATGSVVAITVTDDGPGIEPGTFDQLRAAFARGGRYETRETRGLGLGLTVCDRLLRTCGGRLSLSDTVTGTTVTVTVPAAPTIPIARAPHGDPLATSPT